MDYHEPVSELSDECKTFCRVAHSLIEEAEAICLYHQRLDVETDASAKGVLAHALKEEHRHFLMDLEFLLRQDSDWAEAAHEILFKPGPITDDEEQEQGEDEEQENAQAAPAARSARRWAL